MVASEQRFKFASQLHKNDNTRMNLHAATCCDGNLRPSHNDQKREWHRYDSAGRLLPSQSLSLSCYTVHRHYLGSVDVLEASFLLGTHRLLSSPMHGAAAKMTWLQQSHNIRVNHRHLSCGLVVSAYT